MRFLSSLAVVALATQSVVGDGWFGKTVYNKWHETELERWLSDHDVPYPTPADRKDLENLVNDNWNDYVATPYNKWDANQLSSYLSSTGREIQKGTEKNKDSLVKQVQSSWHETADQASDAYGSVQNWIFDTWTESQLKSFLDYNHIPNPSPRTRDSLLSTARSNFQKAAEAAGETFAYPGDWVYQSWSDSDLKAWLDARGIPVPQTSTRDKLVASLRRNARTASLSAQDAASNAASSASASADSAKQTLSNQLIDSWSESDLKAWFDKNGINVPQGSKLNELQALARKHAARLTGDNVSASAASAYGAATSNAGNYYAEATADLYSQGRHYYDLLMNQFGLASAEASKSLSSASSVASVEASKSSVAAGKSISSASKQASKSASSASSAASSAMSSAKAEL